MKEIGCITPFSTNNIVASKYPICENRELGERSINMYSKYGYDIDFSSETQV